MAAIAPDNGFAPNTSVLGKIFWSEAGGGALKVARANLDGTDIETILPSALVVGLGLDSVSVGPVPTLSVWGMVVLSLSVLISATVILRQRAAR